MTTTPYDQLFSFFGLQQDPFGVSPDVRFFFSTPAHESTLAELLFAIQTRQGLVLLTGEAGAGKTTLLQQLLDTLHRRHVSSSYIFHSRLDADDLFRFILRDFGVECTSRRKGDIIQTLHDWLVRRHSAGDAPVIIIDEAHVLPAETIDELRLLLNLESAGGKLVQIILAGQPELDEKLRRPELRQLRQRVMFRCRIPLLTREETSHYLRSRLCSAGMENPDLFPEPAVDSIFEYSRGIPRTINLLGEHAIINAYAEQQRTVTQDSIRQIAWDFDLVENPLSVSREAGPLPARRLQRFPLLNPEPKSLSGLRMAYLSELPLREPRPPAAPEPQGIVLEELLTFAESPAAHLAPKAPAPARGKSGEIAPEETPSTGASALPQNSEAQASSAVVPILQHTETPAANENGPAPLKIKQMARPNSEDSAFLRYWKDVGRSFRSDVRAFYADWAWMFRGLRRRANGNAVRVEQRHF